MKRPVFAANWKMNHGPTDGGAFLRSFLAQYPRRSDRTVLFFPPAPTLHSVVEAIAGRPDIQAGVQNIHWEPAGAFTGEISAPIARDAGARAALVGHSERRHIFGETEQQTALKCAAASRSGLTPILCVGETLEERERGEEQSVVRRQLAAGLASLDAREAAAALIAYEPVWAIGTGRNATPADASMMHTVIRQALAETTGDRAAAIPILYGGSVSRGNAASLLEAPEVDGLLVGRACLDVDGWAAIART